jgi:hypothetical protein
MLREINIEPRRGFENGVSTGPPSVKFELVSGGKVGVTNISFTSSQTGLL